MTLHAYERVTDGELGAIEVHVIPLEAQHFRLAQAGVKCDYEQGFERITLGRKQERCGLVDGEPVSTRLGALHGIHRRSWIVGEHSVLYGALESDDEWLARLGLLSPAELGYLEVRRREEAERAAAFQRSVEEYAAAKRTRAPNGRLEGSLHAQ
jgi:hypothetical protein